MSLGYSDELEISISGREIKCALDAILASHLFYNQHKSEQVTIIREIFKFVHQYMDINGLLFLRKFLQSQGELAALSYIHSHIILRKIA